MVWFLFYLIYNIGGLSVLYDCEKSDNFKL